MARESAALYDDLELAKIEREVEQTASEAAREALFQSASHLSTVQALLFSATALLEQHSKLDPRLIGLQRSLLEARRHLDFASGVTEGFFASAYTDRESSPALLDFCTEHAAAIASRLAKIESRRQTIDHVRIGRDVVASGITGIDFLLLTVPLLVQSLTLATDGTTARISFDPVSRIDAAYRDPRFQGYLWVNRRNATLSSPGVLISVRVNAPALEDDAASDWLRGKTEGHLNVPSRGMVRVVQKAKGLMGVAVRSKSDKFEIMVALPTVSP